MIKKNFLLISLSLIIIVITTKGWSDDDNEHEGREGKSQSVGFFRRKLINNPTVMNAKFKADCTSCHMAYLPGLLPERSWTKMMSTLDKHFGEDASLDDKTKNEIQNFLVANSSDKGLSRRGGKILSSIDKNDAPLRISETNYFIRKHDEISAIVYKRKAIGSKANCLACHAGAESGNFNEDEVRIPKENEVVKKKR
jgi:hypothetical protein